MAAKKKGPSMLENQRRKLTMQKIAKGGPQLSGVKKPAPAKASPSGRQPRAITNGGSATMKQIRAKAVQANRQTQGKPVMGGAKGKATVLPNSARAGKNLIREGANRMRNMADSGQVRAAQARGAEAKTKAERNRARLNAGVGKFRSDMNKLPGIKQAMALAGGARGGAAQAIADVVAPKPTAKGTLSAGGAQGPAMPKRLQQQGLDAQERKARQSLAARKKATGSKEATPNTAASFDDAFRDARRAKVGSFTWRGKKYTTEMK